jgi:uncharacterized RDD family membrane protein YckC
VNRLEFENTQGIRLQYVTANLVERGFSYAIDALILGIALAILAFLFKGVFPSEDVLMLLVLAPVFFFYSLLFELFNNGKTIGKHLVGIRVIRVDGKPVSTYDYLIRWMFRWIDIYVSLGTLAAIMVGATPRSQRLGDVVADTTVIRTKNMRVPLKRILALNKLSKHVPTYPGVTALKEEQVALIKEVLDRSKKFNNTEHKAVAEDLAKCLADFLQLDQVPPAHLFLQTIIKDYIALTR